MLGSAVLIEGGLRPIGTNGEENFGARTTRKITNPPGSCERLARCSPAFCTDVASHTSGAACPAQQRLSARFRSLFSEGNAQGDLHTLHGDVGPETLDVARVEE